MRLRSVSLALLRLLAAACTDRGADPGMPAPAPDGPFASAEACGTCHPRYLAEWKRSMHAFGGTDPLMLAIADIARQEPGQTVGESCLPCHAAALTRQEQWLAGQTGAVPTEDLTQDGINCDVCHSISIVPPVGTIAFLPEVDVTGPKLGGLREPVPNPAHESLFDNSFTTSINCAPCHQVNLDDGTGLENTFAEWSQSLLSGFGVECQDCHMPQYTGRAAVDAPVREDLHVHEFIGVDYAYEDYRGIDREAQKEKIRALLQNAVSVTAENLPASVAAGDSLTFSVVVTNDRTGHSIPSGTSFAREMWIEVRVADALDRTVFHTGYLDYEGNLVQRADLALFNATMFDAQGQPTPFTWRAVSIDESRLIPFGQSRTASFTTDVPLATVGPLQVDIALRFRPVKPQVVRDLGLDRLLPIEIFDMWSESFTVAVQ